MRIPLSAYVESEAEGLVLGKTEVIRGSFIHEGERAGSNSVPGVRRNHIESGLQLCFKRGLLRNLGFDRR
jgi:hypothetical protein